MNNHFRSGSVAVQAKRGLSTSFTRFESVSKMSASQKFVDFVNDKVKCNKVAVFSKVYCPYCTMAKSALKDAGLKDYFLIELDEVEDGGSIQDALLQITGARTVPRVFIGGKFVGGGSEVRDLQSTGKLRTMLQDAGAL